jgi:hypothetical protein
MLGATLMTNPGLMAPVSENVDRTPSPFRSPCAVAVKLSPTADVPEVV